MNTPMKRTWLILQLWFPAVFAAILAYQLLSAQPDRVPPGLFRLLIWLPMIFYFVAQGNYNYLRALEKRIEALESTAQTPVIGGSER